MRHRKWTNRIFSILLAMMMTIGSLFSVFAEPINMQDGEAVDASQIPAVTSLDNVYIQCYVCVDGEWKLLQQIEPEGKASGRYWVSAAKLESIYSVYGFEASSYAPQDGDRYFPHAAGSGGLWWNALGEYFTVDSNTVIPTGNTTDTTFWLYYTPAYTTGTGTPGNNTGRDNSSLISSNTFYSITKLDPDGLTSNNWSDGTEVEYVFTGETKTITLTDAEGYEWICQNAAGEQIKGTASDNNITFELYGDTSYTITAVSTLQDVTLTVQNGESKTLQVDKGTNLSGWLEAVTDTLQVEGIDYDLSCFDWTLDGTAVTEADIVTEDIVLNGTLKTFSLTLQSDGQETLVLNDTISYGASLSDWLQEHAQDTFGTSDTHSTIGAYLWKIEGTDDYIYDTTSPVKKDLTLVGTPKERKTVTFAAVQPGVEGSDADGGSFIKNDAAYTSISVYQNDTISDAFFKKMQKNIQLKEGYTFVEWRYDAASVGGVGEMPVTSATNIVSDMTVYGVYKTEATFPR